MRIGIVAPPWFEVPPPSYGGIEALCDGLAVGLQRLGHEVVLFSAGTPHPTVPTVTIRDEPPAGLGLPEGGMVELAYAAEVGNALDDVGLDLVHDHTAAGPLLARAREIPTVVTAHGPVDSESGALLHALGNRINVVAISDSQRSQDPRIEWVATIHNGLPVRSFPYREKKDDYLLFLGRMHPNKGVHVAIDVAHAAGLPLIVAAKCAEPTEWEYFHAEVEPRLGRGAEFIGEADGEQKRELLSRARALVFPIQWEEPFGLVMAEALACGTPVVALRRGSVEEVVTDGVTGFVRDDPDELPEAIASLDAIDPQACRRDAERRFDEDVMVGRYEATFAEVLAAPRDRARAIVDAAS